MGTALIVSISSITLVGIGFSMSTWFWKNKYDLELYNTWLFKTFIGKVPPPPKKPITETTRVRIVSEAEAAQEGLNVVKDDDLGISLTKEMLAEQEKLLLEGQKIIEAKRKKEEEEYNKKTPQQRRAEVEEYVKKKAEDRQLKLVLRESEELESERMHLANLKNQIENLVKKKRLTEKEFKTYEELVDELRHKNFEISRNKAVIEFEKNQSTNLRINAINMRNDYIKQQLIIKKSEILTMIESYSNLQIKAFKIIENSFVHLKFFEVNYMLTNWRTYSVDKRILESKIILFDQNINNIDILIKLIKRTPAEDFVDLIKNRQKLMDQECNEKMEKSPAVRENEEYFFTTMATFDKAYKDITLFINDHYNVHKDKLIWFMKDFRVKNNKDITQYFMTWRVPLLQKINENLCSNLSAHIKEVTLKNKEEKDIVINNCNLYLDKLKKKIDEEIDPLKKNELIKIYETYNENKLNILKDMDKNTQNYILQYQEKIETNLKKNEDIIISQQKFIVEVHEIIEKQQTFFQMDVSIMKSMINLLTQLKDNDCHAKMIESMEIINEFTTYSQIVMDFSKEWSKIFNKALVDPNKDIMLTRLRRLKDAWSSKKFLIEGDLKFKTNKVLFYDKSMSEMKVLAEKHNSYMINVQDALLKQKYIDMGYVKVKSFLNYNTKFSILKSDLLLQLNSGISNTNFLYIKHFLNIKNKNESSLIFMEKKMLDLTVEIYNLDQYLFENYEYAKGLERKRQMINKALSFNIHKLDKIQEKKVKILKLETKKREDISSFKQEQLLLKYEKVDLEKEQKTLNDQELIKIKEKEDLILQNNARLINVVDLLNQKNNYFFNKIMTFELNIDKIGEALKINDHNLDVLGREIMDIHKKYGHTLEPTMETHNPRKDKDFEEMQEILADRNEKSNNLINEQILLENQKEYFIDMKFQAMKEFEQYNIMMLEKVDNDFEDMQSGIEENLDALNINFRHQIKQGLDMLTKLKDERLIYLNEALISYLDKDSESMDKYKNLIQSHQNQRLDWINKHKENLKILEDRQKLEILLFEKNIIDINLEKNEDLIKNFDKITHTTAGEKTERKIALIEEQNYLMKTKDSIEYLYKQIVEEHNNKYKIFSEKYKEEQQSIINHEIDCYDNCKLALKKYNDTIISMNEKLGIMLKGVSEVNTDEEKFIVRSYINYIQYQIQMLEKKKELLILQNQNLSLGMNYTSYFDLNNYVCETAKLVKDILIKNDDMCTNIDMQIQKLYEKSKDKISMIRMNYDMRNMFASNKEIKSILKDILLDYSEEFKKQQSVFNQFAKENEDIHETFDSALTYKTKIPGIYNELHFWSKIKDSEQIAKIQTRVFEYPKISEIQNLPDFMKELGSSESVDILGAIESEIPIEELVKKFSDL